MCACVSRSGCFPSFTWSSLGLFMSARNASQLTVSLSSCEWKLLFLGRGWWRAGTFMAPFKGWHLKHRKEGTWKCHTVSRGPLKLLLLFFLKKRRGDRNKQIKIYDSKCDLRGGKKEIPRTTQKTLATSHCVFMQRDNLPLFSIGLTKRHPLSGRNLWRHCGP